MTPKNTTFVTGPQPVNFCKSAIEPDARTTVDFPTGEKVLFRSYAQHLRALGLKGVRKITVSGGFTCPNLDGSKARGGCTYCDNESFSPVHAENGDDVFGQVKRGAEFMRSRFGAERFIAYFQPYSNTYAPLERLRALYDAALAHPEVVGLAVGTRPDCLEPEVIEYLDELGSERYVSLEIGIQSVSDATLRRINRGHTFAEFSEAMDRCHGRRFEICVHVILGLPGEGPEEWVATARALSRWRYHTVKIHPLHVVRGTALARQHATGKYRWLEREQYVQGLCDFLEWVPAETAVQRFTGDAPDRLLVGPSWCKDKTGLLRDMKAEFLRRGTCQGYRIGG